MDPFATQIAFETIVANDEIGFLETRMIERIVVAGMTTQPQSIRLVIEKNTAPIEFEYDAHAQIFVVRKPNVSAVQDWTIEFN